MFNEELLLYNDSKLQDVIDEWPQTEFKYFKPEKNFKNTITGKKFSLEKFTEKMEPMQFLFRTTSILPLDALEKHFNEPASVYLFYLQAVYDVINSNYPTALEDAIELAGIQMHVTLGDFDQQKHVPGYLKKFVLFFCSSLYFGNLKPKKKPVQTDSKFTFRSIW